MATPVEHGLPDGEKLTHLELCGHSRGGFWTESTRRNGLTGDMGGGGLKWHAKSERRERDGTGSVGYRSNEKKQPTKQQR